MKITLKLFASLAAHLPAEARSRHRVELEVDPGVTVADLIRRQGIPPGQCAIVLVDGVWVAAFGMGDANPCRRPGSGHLAPGGRRLMSDSLSLEMTLSREEFLRLLPGAVGLAVATEEAGVSGVGMAHRRWRIRLIPLADSVLGSVALPRHRIEIQLEGYRKGELAAFMARFHRGFQRGGG